MRRTRSTGPGRGKFVTMNPGAAGIDIGSRAHVVAVGSDRDTNPVRSFGTFTGDLHRLADWLGDAGITTVAMESTSVYWIPVYELLEERGFEVLLVNARTVKNVPGRKTDVNDAQWLQQLHEFGLLRGSFRPSQEIVTLRSYIRVRERFVEYAASHIQQMQKALDQMNVQLHHVVSQLAGKTGLAIVRAIVGGQRDPEVLAAHRNPQCKASIEVMVAALEGNYRDEHVFALAQSLEVYDCFQARIKECDVEIERVLQSLAGETDSDIPSWSGGRPKARQHNTPNFDVRRALQAVIGTDLCQIDGLGPYTSLKLIAECGTDMTRWPTARHFTSWLGLAPANKISGGRVLSSRTRRTGSRAAALLRLCAVTIGRSDTALGAHYRRLSARVGKSKAVTATARKIAVLFYNTMRYGMVYQDPGAAVYDQRYRERTINNLRRRAESLGLKIIDPGPPIQGVS